MATGTASNRCSMCPKGAGICICAGCKKFFCVKHFTEHRQQLSVQFDHEIVRPHDELLEQINKPKQSNDSFVDLFSQIDRWENVTMKKIQEAAKRARQQLTELVNGERETLTKQLGKVTKEIRRRREEDDFVEDDVAQLRQKITQLHQLLEEQAPKMILVTNNEIDWTRLISIKTEEETTPQTRLFDIDPNARWTQNGIIVAGGNGEGGDFHQLSRPVGLFLDDDETVYIADTENHRIVEWKSGDRSGQVVAGGNGRGNRTGQLNRPSGVIVDKQTDSLIICDYGNRRVVRWSCRGGTSGQTIISDVGCYGLTMEDDGILYVTDTEKNEIRRWRVGETTGIVMAGGNGEGNRRDQFDFPGYVFVDRDHSVYVSDMSNHRVMKWVKGEKEGIVVAGGRGQGNALIQLSSPYGVVVDQLGTVYVADFSNHRIMRWPKGATQGSIVVGGNGGGEQANQLFGPTGLSFDRHGNLYVANQNSHRVQKFLINRHS